jgi:hypothetical protein
MAEPSVKGGEHTSVGMAVAAARAAKVMVRRLVSCILLVDLLLGDKVCDDG